MNSISASGSRNNPVIAKFCRYLYQKNIQKNISLYHEPQPFNRRCDISRTVCKPIHFKLNSSHFCTDNSKTCWKCGNSVLSRNLFCNKCNSIQQANKDGNYFDLLDINSTFDVKNEELSRNYRKLQSVLHPDKFGNRSEEERMISEEYSSLINKAYNTLQNPLERALYMLKLEGVSIEEGNTEVDSEFLMDVMERNEALEELTQPEKINELNAENKKCIGSLVAELSAAFESRNLSLAKKIVTKLKYFSSIDTKIKEMRRKQGIND